MPNRLVYAAFGDSMSIDDYAGGPGRGAASLLWRNRDDDFPTWAGRDLMGPDAPIVVATVYDPSDGSGDAGRLGLPPWPQALDRLAELNQALRALADAHRALVADVHARFLGHGLAAGDPTQPAARPPDRALWYSDLIEPNAWGQARSEVPSGRRWRSPTSSGHDGCAPAGPAGPAPLERQSG